MWRWMKIFHSYRSELTICAAPAQNGERSTRAALGSRATLDNFPQQYLRPQSRSET